MTGMEVEGAQSDSFETATQELMLIKQLAPPGSGIAEQPRAESSDRRPELGEMESRQKYQKGGPKGQHHGPDRGRGKGRGPNKAKAKDPAFFTNYWDGRRRQQDGQGWDKKWGPRNQDPWEDTELVQDNQEDYRTVVNLMATLVLRHETQSLIHKQDTAFVLFLKTDVENNLAVSTYQVGQKWHELKQHSPEELRMPMRATLFQHLLHEVKDRFEKMVASPSSRSTAVALDWMTTDETAINALKWDAEARKHVKDTTIQPIKINHPREALKEMVVACVEPGVVARYHATRKLAEQYRSPTLTMLLEVGLRTDEANLMWKRLVQLEKSGVWVASGVFLRRESMSRSGLAQRLAAVTGQ